MLRFRRLVGRTESPARPEMISALERRVFLAGDPLTSLPILHSLPSAIAKIHLDFDGDIARDWGGTPVPETPAFDTDSDPTSFSEAEKSAIREIWARVAEIFSPFNIDVTTEDPGDLTDRRTIKAVIGGDGSWYSSGEHSAGGVGYIDAFSNSSPNVVYVFEDVYPGGDPRTIAEAAAHELGHGFGLHHQSSYDELGQLVHEYDPGDANVAPIMGVSYHSGRGLWRLGPTIHGPGAIQDDLAMLARPANGFGYRPDDHGNLPGNATVLAGPGSIRTATGVIERPTDVDVFTFETGSGIISIRADVAQYGPMLDIRMELRDSFSNLVAAYDSPSSLGAWINASVAAGEYTLHIKGVQAYTGPLAYADVGQYTLTAEIVEPKVTIGDFVFNDDNGNGLQDPGEGGVPNVTVHLFRASDDSLVETSITSQGGFYAFPLVPQGEYYLQVVPPAGYVISARDRGNDTLDSDADPVTGYTSKFVVNTGADLTRDFGLIRTRLKVEDVTVNETNSGTTSATFLVTAHRAPNTPLSINYTTSSGTATENVDFLPISGTLNFGPNETTKTITVQVIGDGVVETDETFFLHLDPPFTFAESDLHAQATIVNDDFPSLSISDATVSEGNSGTTTATFTVTLSQPSPFAVSVSYATSPGLATTGSDFVATSGTLTFQPGETSKTFAVAVLGDTTIEPTETFNVNLTGASNATLADAHGQGTIINDDIPTITVQDVTIAELEQGQSLAVFSVVLNGPFEQDVTVNYSTSDGSARAGLDYLPVSGTLTFSPGRAVRTIAVPVLSDLRQEPAETFNLNLTSPVNARLGRSVAVATISNHELRTVTVVQGKPHRFIDTTGSLVTVALAGPGTATLVFANSEISDISQVLLTGTTFRTSLAIRAAAPTRVTDIIADADMGVIMAPTTELRGLVNLPGGVSTLFVQNAVGAQISIGPSPARMLRAMFGHVVNSTLDSDMAVAMLRVLSWQEDTAALDFSAPAILNITSLGDFTAEVSSDTIINRVAVNGSLRNADIQARQRIMVLTAGTIAGSRVFAAVKPDIHALPQSPADFTDPAGYIGNVTVRSRFAGAFSDSLIAAPVINLVNLSQAQTANNGAPTGVAAVRINVVRAFNPRPIALTRLFTPANSWSQDDLLIRIIS